MPDVATLPAPSGPAPLEFTTDQVALLKRTVANGATDDELRLLFHMARRTGLDPFLRQLYAIRRWDASVGREVMTFQCGIDGLRLIAERTGRYAPGRAPTFVYAEPEPGRNRLATPPAPQLVSATAFIKKQTLDGTWHEVAATARFDEYVQQTKQGQPTRFWIRMPHGQLAKCAEALALRRAFPQETSGVYTHDEMQQASDETPPLEAVGETPITTRGEPDEPAPAFVEFKGQQLRTAGVTQETFDRIQRACRTVGKPYASKVLQQLHGVESVLELTEPLATLYLDSLETAAEGRTPETP